MKNKGQALVLFIIFIPIFLIIVGICVDFGVNLYNENKFHKVSEEIVKTLLDNENLKNIVNDDEDKIVKILKEQASLLYDANKMETNNLVITNVSSDEITLYNTYEHYSFMNSLFGRGNGVREISVEITGSIKEGNKIIEFKGDTDEN